MSSKNKPLSNDVDLGKIAELTEDFSGAETNSVVNVSVSFVLQKYLSKYSSPEDAAKHASEASISMENYIDAVKKIKKQRETQPGQKVTVPYYR
jgi:transitional endoplasmic reticulum ATPase